MTEYDNKLSGALFQNHKAINEKRADYKEILHEETEKNFG